MRGLAGDQARRSLLHSLRPSQRRWQPAGSFRQTGRWRRHRPDARSRCAGAAGAAAGRRQRAEGGAESEYDALIFLQRGIRLHPIDDTMLMSYVLEGGLHGHGMDELSVLHLSHTPIAFSEVTGKGKEKVTFDCVPVK